MVAVRSRPSTLTVISSPSFEPHLGALLGGEAHQRRPGVVLGPPGALGERRARRRRGGVGHAAVAAQRPVLAGHVAGGPAVDPGDDAAQHRRGLDVRDARLGARRGRGRRRAGRSGCRRRSRTARAPAGPAVMRLRRFQSIWPTAASTLRPRPSDITTEAVSAPGPPTAPSASRSAGRPARRAAAREPPRQRAGGERGEKQRRERADHAARGPERERARVATAASRSRPAPPPVAAMTAM